MIGRGIERRLTGKPAGYWNLMVDEENSGAKVGLTVLRIPALILAALLVMLVIGVLVF